MAISARLALAGRANCFLGLPNVSGTRFCLPKRTHQGAGAAGKNRLSGARGQLLLEGIHLLDAALNHCLAVDEVLVQSRAGPPGSVGAAGAPASQLSRPRSQRGGDGQASSLNTPPELVAVIPTPAAAAPNADDSLLLLDAVQDPGNLGAILRTAAAAGVRQVWLSPQCADPWSAKVLRAGMGAHFAVALHTDAELTRVLAEFNGPAIVTSLDATQSLYALDLRQPCAFVFGNEGAGVSASAGPPATWCASRCRVWRNPLTWRRRWRCVCLSKCASGCLAEPAFFLSSCIVRCSCLSCFLARAGAVVGALADLGLQLGGVQNRSALDGRAGVCRGPHRTGHPHLGPDSAGQPPRVGSAALARHAVAGADANHRLYRPHPSGAGGWRRRQVSVLALHHAVLDPPLAWLWLGERGAAGGWPSAWRCWACWLFWNPGAPVTPPVARGAGAGWRCQLGRQRHHRQNNCVPPIRWMCWR